MKAGKLLLLLLTITYSAIAQTQFSKRYSFNIPGDLFSSMLIQGDTIFIAGVSSDTTQNDAEMQTSKNLSGLSDLEGNIIAHSVYIGDFKKNYETFFHTLIKSRQSGFALCAGSFDTTGLDQALFIKYDSLMNVMMVKEFKYPDSVLYLEGESMIQMNDGCYYIAAEIDLNYVAYISLLKLDSNANLIWWRKYNSQPPLSDDFPSMLQLTDTTLLMGCEHSNELESPYSVTSQTKLMVIDTGGNILTQWMDSNDSTFAPYGLMKTRDGGYAYCGRYRRQMNAPYDVPLTEGVITKLDSNFQLSWRKIFRDTGDLSGAIFYQMHELPDGSLITAGIGQNWNVAAQNYSPTGWFAKVSAAGDSIWSRMYRGVPGSLGSDNNNFINDFQLLPEGGLLGCGESDNDTATSFIAQAWLIRLDSLGCLIPGCDTLTATGLSPVLTNGNHTGIAVYPNPANSIVYLLIKSDSPNPQLSFNVYDATGKPLNTEKDAVPDITYLLHVNNYASGLYFVQVLDGEAIVATSKFVKE